MAVEKIATELESFIREQFQVEDDDAFFSREVNLWEEGYVDSAGVVEVIAHLEETYSVKIPKKLLFDPGFTCIDGMAERIERLR